MWREQQKPSVFSANRFSFLLVLICQWWYEIFWWWWCCCGFQETVNLLSCFCSAVPSENILNFIFSAALFFLAYLLWSSCHCIITTQCIELPLAFDTKHITLYSLFFSLFSLSLCLNRFDFSSYSVYLGVFFFCSCCCYARSLFSAWFQCYCWLWRDVALVADASKEIFSHSLMDQSGIPRCIAISWLFHCINASILFVLFSWMCNTIWK